MYTISEHSILGQVRHATDDWKPKKILRAFCVFNCKYVELDMNESNPTDLNSITIVCRVNYYLSIAIAIAVRVRVTVTVVHVAIDLDLDSSSKVMEGLTIN